MEQSSGQSVEGVDDTQTGRVEAAGIIPSNINIIGRPYKVVYDTALSKILGEQSSVELLIRIKPNMPLFIESETLLHETLHGLDEAMQLNMSERQVYCLAAGLMAMLSENQDYLEYLNKVLKK